MVRVKRTRGAAAVLKTSLPSTALRSAPTDYRQRHAQRFLGAHAAVYNLFNLGMYLVGAEHYRNLRVSAFEEWGRAVAWVLRIDLAKHYLSKSDLSIAAITERLHFTDAAAFSRFFKKKTGYPPRKYSKHKRSMENGAG
jgi:hypothetical protein